MSDEILETEKWLATMSSAIVVEPTPPTCNCACCKTNADGTPCEHCYCQCPNCKDADKKQEVEEMKTITDEEWASSFIVNNFRRKIANHLAGGNTLRPIGYIAYGEGGHDADTNEALEIQKSVVSLNAEFLRQKPKAVFKPSATSITARGIIASDDVPNGVFSECGLYDVDGDLIAVRNFKPKFVEDGEEYTVEVTIRF